MTEIEEMAIYKRKFEIEEEKKQEKETMQRELQDYVDGKIKYNELSRRARFFLLIDKDDWGEAQETFRNKYNWL